MVCAFNGCWWFSLFADRLPNLHNIPFGAEYLHTWVKAQFGIWPSNIGSTANASLGNLFASAASKAVISSRSNLASSGICPCSLKGSVRAKKPGNWSAKRRSEVFEEGQCLTYLAATRSNKSSPR